MHYNGHKLDTDDAHYRNQTICEIVDLLWCLLPTGTNHKGWKLCNDHSYTWEHQDAVEQGRRANLFSRMHEHATSVTNYLRPTILFPHRVADTFATQRHPAHEGELDPPLSPSRYKRDKESETRL